MAFNPAPNNWIPNWDETTGTISVPVATFPQLTNAEAHETTGDIRKVLFAINEQLALRWTAIAQADRPAKMTITKTQTLDAVGNIVVNYSHTFVLTPTTIDVTAE